MKSIFTLVVATFFGSIAFQSSAAEKVTIPKGYEKWDISKDKIVSDKSSLFYGIHNIYVDPKAMKSYKAGVRFPEGSRFVVVQYAIREDAGKLVKGKKSMVVLMRKDKRQAETGGWQFAGFTPEGKPSSLDPVKNCFDCHLKDAGTTDYVISKYSDFR